MVKPAFDNGFRYVAQPAELERAENERRRFDRDKAQYEAWASARRDAGYLLPCDIPRVDLSVPTCENCGSFPQIHREQPILPVEVKKRHNVGVDGPLIFWGENRYGKKTEDWTGTIPVDVIKRRVII